MLAVTGGHRVDIDAFTAMLDAICAEHGWEWEHAVQPDAQRHLSATAAQRWDAVLLHDIAGLSLRRGDVPRPVGPDLRTQAALLAMLDAGVGLVVTHHALASWPSWDRWAHAVGGRFLYAPGTLDGEPVEASGYRLARHRIEVVEATHPVCAGVQPFEVDDELYLCPVFEDEVTPLLVTTADMRGQGFVSTFDEVAFGQAAVTCSGRADGSRLVGWTTTCSASRVVYLQPGHGPETMGHPQYRRLVGNALAWVGT